MIIPTPKPMWKWVVRQYFWKTGRHEIIKSYDSQEEARDYVRQLREKEKETRGSSNYEYEKVEAGRPDLHHERLMEEWGYKK